MNCDDPEWEEGWQAAVGGRGLGANPYPVLTNAFKVWEAGWRIGHNRWVASCTPRVPLPRPTFAQIGRLLALQEAAGVRSNIPETAREAQAAIEKLENLQAERMEELNATTAWA